MTTEIATEISVDPSAQIFDLRGTPVLEAGRFDETIASTDGMKTRIKVYAEGGENASHTHLDQDHLFFVLAGQATFLLGRHGEESKVVNRYEGVLLPKGAYYRFQSSGDENLVMLRVDNRSGTEPAGRIGPNGRPLPGHSKENLHVDGVPVPGKFFVDNQ